MESEGEAEGPTPGSDQERATGQVDQVATEVTLICLASDQSVQETLAAGAQGGTSPTVISEAIGNVISAPPDDELSDQGCHEEIQDSDGTSVVSVDAVIEEETSDATDDGQEVKPDDQQEDQGPYLEEPPADTYKQETQVTAPKEADVASAPAIVKQRSLSDEETPCADHPKEKTYGYCDTCNVKVCFRCVIKEHRAGTHDIIPFEDQFEMEDVSLVTLVASIRDDCQVTEELEGGLESSKVDFVRGIEALVAGIEREVQTSRDSLKEQCDAEVQKINHAYDKRIAELEERREKKIDNLRRQGNRQVKDIERRLSWSRELRDQSTVRTDEWAASQAGMQLDELKEAIGDASNISAEFKEKKKDLRDLAEAPVENNKDIEEQRELKARVLDGSYKGMGQQTVSSGSITIEDLKSRVATLTVRTAQEYWGEQEIGDVAVKTSSIVQNRRFASGNLQQPVSIEAPDCRTLLLRDSDESRTDVMFLSPTEAEKLAALVGGVSDVTLQMFCGLNALKSSKGSKEESLQVFVVCKRGYLTAIKERKRSELRGYNYFFPVDANLRDVMKTCGASSVSTLVDFETGDQLPHSLTVREWRKKYKDWMLLY